MDDADLLGRIAGGDKAAMKVFYQRHERALFHFLRNRTGDAFEASDVLQETFLEVWRSAGRWEGRSSAKTWLYGIGRNKAVDRLRKAARTELREADETIPDETPSPYAVLEAASDATRLRHCIEGLAPVQRTAIRLAYFEDLSYPEIAEVEGVALGTVKTRIHHAKKLLMRCLTQMGVVAGD